MLQVGHPQQNGCETTKSLEPETTPLPVISGVITPVTNLFSAVYRGYRPHVTPFTRIGSGPIF